MVIVTRTQISEYPNHLPPTFAQLSPTCSSARLVIGYLPQTACRPLLIVEGGKNCRKFRHAFDRLERITDLCQLRPARYTMQEGGS